MSRHPLHWVAGAVLAVLLVSVPAVLAAPLPDLTGNAGLVWRDPAPLLPDATPLPEGVQFRLGRQTGPQTIVQAFSADGKIVAATHASGAASGTVQAVHLWDTATGKYLRSVRGQDTGTMSVAFSPDGQTLATAGIDNTLRFWEVKSGAALGEPIRLPGHGYSLDFSPDGKRLVVGSNDMELFETATRAPVKMPFAEANRSAYYFVVAWSADGKHIAGGTSNFIRIWNAETGAIVQTLKTTFNAHVNRFVFSADGKSLLVSASPKGLLHQWEIATGKQLKEIPTPDGTTSPDLIFFSHDGSRLAWLEQKRPYDRSGRTVVLADGAGKELKRLEVPSPLASLRLSPDGKVLATGGANGSFRLWDTDSGREQYLLLDGAAPLFRLAYGEGGKSLRSIHTDGSLHEWDPVKGQELRRARLHLPADEYLMTATPDGRFLVTASSDGQATVWNTRTGKALPKPSGKLFVRPPPLGPRGFQRPPVLPGGPPDVLVRLSPDGKFLLGLTGNGEVLTIWDTETGKVTTSVNPPEGAASGTVSADGESLFLGGRQIEWRELKTGKQKRSWATTPGPERQGLRWTQTIATDLHLLPDGKTLAVVEEQVYHLFPPPPIPPGGRVPERRFAQVRLIDLGEGKMERSFPADGAAVAFSADGKQLACTLLGKLRLYDLASGQTFELPLKDKAPVPPAPATVAFRQDGKQLATGGADGILLLWDVNKLRQKPVAANAGEK